MVYWFSQFCLSVCISYSAHYITLIFQYVVHDHPEISYHLEPRSHYEGQGHIKLMQGNSNAYRARAVYIRSNNISRSYSSTLFIITTRFHMVSHYFDPRTLKSRSQFTCSVKKGVHIVSKLYILDRTSSHNQIPVCC